MIVMSKDLRNALRAALSGRTPGTFSQEGARDASVLIPIVAIPEPTVIFTVRTETVPSHKGQISFPGGSRDPGDSSAIQTALRETQEEIGLDPAAVDVLGQLDAFPTFVSGFVVTPVIGWLEDEPDLRPNPAEVASILHVPLADLNEDIRSEAGFSHRDKTYPTEAWVWQEHVIWGVTARIVRSFLWTLSRAGLIDPPGETTSWTGFPLPDVDAVP
jgi:8-oxo-dGTP pyrophosphatase MutT (NUDIX family)